MESKYILKMWAETWEQMRKTNADVGYVFYGEEPWPDDKDFTIACEELESITETSNKIEYLYYHNPEIFYLFGVIERTINNKNYRYGIDLNEPGKAIQMAKYAIKKSLDNWPEKSVQEIESRLQKCELDEEKLHIVEERLRQLASDVNNYMPDRGFEYGYNTQKLYEEWSFRDFHLNWFSNGKKMQDPGYYYEYVMKAIAGAKSYLEERELKKIIKRINNQSTAEAPTPDNIFSLNTAPEKLLYIKYSGIYEALKKIHTKSTGEPNKRKIAKIIAHITGEKVSNLVVLLSSLDDPNKAASNTPYTENAVKNTIKALEEADVESKELESILHKFLKSVKD